MITVTAKAQGKLKEVLDASGDPAAAVRITAVRGPHGCIHGWRLAVEHMASPEAGSVQAEPVRVLLEPEEAEALEGATLDYREDTSGIGFSIEVPTPTPRHEHDGGCHRSDWQSPYEEYYTTRQK